MIRAVLVIVLGLVACAEPEPAPEPVIWLDATVFEREILPILGERCGNPSCHGRSDRPLAIYSPGRWRADPARVFLPEPLTAEELEHDYAVACVFAAHGGSVEDAPLLLEPLGAGAGVYHGGGAVFAGTTDRDYRALAAWIEAGWNR